jgi:hypothetical protein
VLISAWQKRRTLERKGGLTAEAVGEFETRSCRIGGATRLFEMGATADVIKELSRGMAERRAQTLCAHPAATPDEIRTKHVHLVGGAFGEVWFLAPTSMAMEHRQQGLRRNFLFCCVVLKKLCPQGASHCTVRCVLLRLSVTCRSRSCVDRPVSGVACRKWRIVYGLETET